MQKAGAKDTDFLQRAKNTSLLKKVVRYLIFK
jgi:hypothetical protein